MLLLPPFIIDGLKAIHCVPSGKWGNIITQLGAPSINQLTPSGLHGVSVGCDALAIAAFTAVQPLAVSKLEPDLRAQLEKSGYNDANVYFDRGV